jgi:hypothetical protein
VDTLVDPLRITEVHFEQTVVAPGQTITISAVLTGEFDGSPTIEWAVDAGELSSTNTLETTWTAPETNQLVAISLLVSVDQPGYEDNPNQSAFETDVIVGTGIDHDGDGYSIGEGDCDDTNVAIYPGAPDLEDGLDNDCDGIVDEGSPEFDDDGDGFSDLEGDCDDADPLINPAAEERLNGVDDDCDGTIDEGTDAYDDDGDGFTEQEGDCNDLTSSVNPGAQEILDGVDNDCDGIVDEGTAAYDDDGDGYSELEGDCDDDAEGGAGAAASPVGIEIADGIDNDCNGIIDDGDFALDDDGDGWSELAGDCDDDNIYTYPGAPEFSDLSDNDCDGNVDNGMDTVDDDNDTFSEADGDCDDYNDAIYPGAPEIEDSPLDYDNDCDGFGFVNPPFAVATASAGPYDTCNLILLDGSQSWDPDGDSFIFYWYFAWQPINSDLDTPNINNGSSANADFQPDVPGLWIVGLLTNDAMFNSTPSFLEFDVADGGVCP